MSSRIIHTIYASTARNDLSAANLGALLEKARQNNAALGLTGMLLYTGGRFFQVLEGPAETVDCLFEKIRHDARHCDVSRIIREPIRKRVFGDWSMGFAQATESELNKIDGLNDFFEQRRCLVDLDHGRAKKLLTAFTEGHWRGCVAQTTGRAA